MQFDPDNAIVQLCAKGMEKEGQGDKIEALLLFQRAWNEASNHFEKMIAAHYVARHQDTITDKLHWDETALALALQINDDNAKTSYPSLYLNIARCYEDLNDLPNAAKNYKLAFLFTHHLPDDGYGKMIKTGIINGLSRVNK